jgi:hypothetical protein
MVASTRSGPRLAPLSSPGGRSAGSNVNIGRRRGPPAATAYLTFSSYAAVATADTGAIRLYSSAASRRQSTMTATGPTGSGGKTASMRR